MSRRTRPMSRCLGAKREAAMMTARLDADRRASEERTAAFLLDIVRARAHNPHMDTTPTPDQMNMTGQQIVDAVRAGTMTQEQVVEILRARMDADRASRVVSFGKAPAGGWTDADKVSK